MKSFAGSLDGMLTLFLTFFPILTPAHGPRLTLEERAAHGAPWLATLNGPHWTRLTPVLSHIQAQPLANMTQQRKLSPGPPRSQAASRRAGFGMKVLLFRAFSTPPPHLDCPSLSPWSPSRASLGSLVSPFGPPACPSFVSGSVSKWAPFHDMLHCLLRRLSGLVFCLPNYSTGSVRVPIVVYPSSLPALPDALLNTRQVS